jgi:hypothetical protein
MEEGYAFQEFTPGQQRTYAEALEVYAAFREAEKAIRAFRGGRHWKRIKGRDYLYQYFDRLGHGQSLGPRSPHTEALWAAFSKGRQAAAARLKEERRQLAEQARFCRAARLTRLPRLAAKILGLLGRREAGGEPLVVIDAHALYAYEFAAGAFLQGPRTADLLDQGGLGLTLFGDLPPDDLLALLLKADRSFALGASAGLTATNRQGFQVRILAPGTPAASPSESAAAARAAAGNLSQLLAAPLFSQVVIGQDGLPVPMVVPDPRAFALHRLTLSELPGRDQGQRARDLELATALAALILRYLPQYHFFHADLRRFPAEVVPQAARLTGEPDLAGNLEVEY